MSEIPAPYNADSNKTDIELIAHFMNGFLGKELLADIDIPKHLHKKYENMTPDEMDELFEFAFQEIFKEAGIYIADHLNARLRLWNLI